VDIGGANITVGGDVLVSDVGIDSAPTIESRLDALNAKSPAYLWGPIANRPSAGSVAAGTVYRALDRRGHRNEFSTSTGTAWVGPPTAQHAVRTASQSALLHAGNPAEIDAALTSAHFEIRTTSSTMVMLEHASVGVVDQSISVRNELDQPVNVSLFVMMRFGGIPDNTLGNVFNYLNTTGARLDTGEMVHLAPNVDGIVPLEVTRKAFAVPALRQPHEMFRLEVAPKGDNPAPTSGQIRVSVHRRY